jgi:hypothetical protein
LEVETQPRPSPRHAVTVVLTKLGSYRFVGHRDLARTLVRLLRLSRFPLDLTTGFRPIPRMVLPEPLPVGVASEAERFVVFLSEPWSPEQVSERLGPRLPRGLEIVAVLEGDQREPLETPIRLRLEGERPEELREVLRALTAGDLGLARLDLSGEDDLVEVELRPYPGQRASVGRLLRRLREHGGDRVGWLRSVLRRAPLI